MTRARQLIEDRAAGKNTPIVEGSTTLHEEALHAKWESIRKQVNSATEGVFDFARRGPPTHPSLQEAREALHRATLSMGTYSVFLATHEASQKA